MIISDLYQTKIEIVQGDTTTPYYNVNIDSTDVTVIVSLIDFNGENVKRKNVTLTVDKGTISSVKTGYTGTIASGGKSVTGTTGDDGKFKVTYTASEWGLCTFTANNSNIQLRVTGWKQIGGDNKYHLWVNEEIKLLRMRLNIPSTSYAIGHQTVLSSIIPSKYLNNTNTGIPWRQDSDLRIDVNGDLRLYCAKAVTDGMYMWFTWSYGT